MDFMPQVIGGDEEIEEKVESIQEPLMSNSDIFDEPKLVMKPVKDEPVKKTRKKRVMTEAQKENLAKARVKALETRRKNSALKKEMKDLEKMKKEQALDELRSSVGKPVKKKVDFVAEQITKEPMTEEPMEEEPKPKPKHVTYNNTISDKQIEEISMNAIMNYDKVRKERKKDKEVQRKKDMEKEQERQELLKLTQRARPQPTHNSYWDNCY